MAYIGNSPGSIQRGRRAVYEFTATNAQTVFSGTDDNGISLDLQDSNENDVYLNGSRLIFNDDYTIAGEVLTLTAAAAAGDILVIVTQDDVANVASYTKAEADARYINYDGDIVNGDIQVVGNITTDALTVGDGHTIGNDGGDNLKITSSNAEGIIIDSNQYLALWGGNTQRAVVASNGDISFYEDTGQEVKFFWDASAESLGIGTDSLAGNNRLHVHNGGNTTGLLLETSAIVSRMAFKDANTTDANTVRIGSQTDDMTFIAGGSERMRIDASGIVKIGRYNSGIPTGYAVTNSVLNVYSDTNLGTTAGDELKLLSLSGHSGNQSALTFRHRRLTDGNTFFSDAFTLTQDVDNSEKVYTYMKFHDGVVVVDNNLGIGTNNPAAPLEVHHATVPLVKIKATTSSGQAALYLDGYSDGGSTQRASRINFRKDTTTEWSIINDYTQNDSNRLDFEYAGSSKITFTGDGEVGIGVASPEQKLDIMSGTLVIRPTTASADANGSASAVNNLIHLRMPYGASAGSVSNNGARVGIKFTGRNDGAGYGSDDGKSAAIYGVSEETGAGYNRQFGMAFYTSAFDQSQAEKARLDHAGRWMVPNQPAACFKSSTSTTNTQRFGAVSVLLNNGNNLDTGSNSGRFNCPVTGMYRVTINTSTAYNGHYGWLGIRKNGTLQLDHIHWNKAGTTMHVNPSIQLIIQCSSGDYLEGWYINANTYGQDTIDMAMITMELIG